MFEARNLAALGIDARHHVLDSAILAGSVHRLKDDQDRPTVGRVQAILDCGERGNILGKHRLGETLAFCFRQLGIPVPTRVIVLELDRLAVGNTPLIDEFVG